MTSCLFQYRFGEAGLEEVHPGRTQAEHNGRRKAKSRGHRKTRGDGGQRGREVDRWKERKVTRGERQKAKRAQKRGAGGERRCAGCTEKRQEKSEREKKLFCTTGTEPSTALSHVCFPPIFPALSLSLYISLSDCRLPVCSTFFIPLANPTSSLAPSLLLLTHTLISVFSQQSLWLQWFHLRTRLTLLNPACSSAGFRKQAWRKRRILLSWRTPTFPCKRQWGLKGRAVKCWWERWDVSDERYCAPHSIQEPVHRVNVSELLFCMQININVTNWEFYQYPHNFTASV